MILRDDTHIDPSKATNFAEYINPALSIVLFYWNAKNCYYLWLEDSIREDRTKSKFLKVRIMEVEEYRKTIKTPVHSSPWLFASNMQPGENYLAVPRIFSGNREYFTAQQEIKDVIASEDLFTIKDPEVFAFSVIESSMFMAWQDLVGGRLKEENRFSNTLV